MPSSALLLGEFEGTADAGQEAAVEISGSLRAPKVKGLRRKLRSKHTKVKTSGADARFLNCGGIRP